MGLNGSFQNEEAKEKHIEENANPYQRLNYIYELALFYKQIDDFKDPEDFKNLINKLVNITKKYKKL